MAFLPPEEENKNAPEGTTSNNPGGDEPPDTAGGSAGDSGGAAPKAGAAPSSGTPTQFGSSSSKLGDYLTANAPQIGQQANTISQGLNNQYGQIQGDINQGLTNFGQQVQQGYTAPNQAVVNQAIKDPTKFVQDPNNVSQFQAQYNNQYKGPGSYSETTPYSNVQNEVNNAVQGAKSLGTQGGLQNYFASTNKNPTAASNTLDSLLIQGNPDAQKQVQTAASQFNNLGGQLGQTQTQADAQVKAAQEAAKSSNQYAHDQYGNAVTGFNTNLQNELNTALKGNTDYNTQIQNLRSQLQGGDLSNAPGVSQGLKDFLANQLNPWMSQYGQGNKSAYNFVDALPSNVNPQLPQLGSVANQNDYATMAALGHLGGAPIESPLSAYDPTQAGTYQTPTIGNLDNQKVAQDLLNGFTGGPELRVSQQPYQQYLTYEQALNNYLNNGKNAWGAFTPPGTVVPTIS